MVSDPPREHGFAPDDVTSYLPSQKEWGPDRERNWPEILHRLERRELPVSDYLVGNLVYNGRVVLDLDNRPVLDFVDLPATLSTEFSGRCMEAISRLDPRISHGDFRARMPKTRRMGRDGQTVRPSCSLSAIGMRMTRFRQEHGLISWTKREGSDNIRDFLINKLPQQNIEANSTRGVLPPSLLAQADARSRNKGQYSARAGGRALSQQERQNRNNKETERLAKLREAEVEFREEVRVQVGSKRKRATKASPDSDEVEVMSKRCKVGSPPQTLHSTLEIPLLPSPQPCQSVPPPQASRKRNRDVSCSENYDERSSMKRPCRRSASPPQRVEEGDSARKVDDTTQSLMEEDITFNDANGEDIGSFGDVSGSPVAPEVLVVPEVFAAPKVRMVPEAPLTPDAHMTPEAPAIRRDNRESEGSPLEFSYNVIAEEFTFPSFDEEMTLGEILQRDLDKLDCENPYLH